MPTVLNVHQTREAVAREARKNKKNKKGGKVKIVGWYHDKGTGE